MATLTVTINIGEGRAGTRAGECQILRDLLQQAGVELSPEMATVDLRWDGVIVGSATYTPSAPR